MKKLVVLTSVFLFAAAYAEERSSSERTLPSVSAGVRDANGKRLSREDVHQILYRHNGGKLKIPGVQKGVVTYVNAQNSVPKEWLEQNAGSFSKHVKIDIRVVDGVFDLANPKIEGNASLFVVDNANLPSLLVAPESKWALVNVAPLKKGRGEKEAFFSARVKKELTRGFAMLCGATSSNYPESITGCVTDAEQLDKFADCVLPVDVLARFEPYLKGYGVVPYQMTTYRKACQEGWAPAPVDAIQKKIWDEVHEMPTEPITIKPEKSVK